MKVLHLDIGKSFGGVESVIRTFVQTKNEEIENYICSKAGTMFSKEMEKYIDDYYLTGYKRIRNQARNGLAVVTIERDACGGCFSKIPPQRQSEIKMHKKVIVCEYCGRILVDDDIAQKAKANLEK